MSNNLEDSLGYDIRPSEENINKEITVKFNQMKYRTMERDKLPKTNNMDKLNSKNINANPFSLHKNKNKEYGEIKNLEVLPSKINLDKDNYSRKIKFNKQ